MKKQIRFKGDMEKEEQLKIYCPGEKGAIRTMEKSSRVSFQANFSGL